MRNRDEPSVEELIETMPESRRQVLASGGMTPQRLREMAATKDGARKVRMLLADWPEDEPAQDRSTEELLDRLSAQDRRRLADAGVTLDVLRNLCRTERGVRLARQILATHTDLIDAPEASQPERTARRERFVTEGHPDGAAAGQAAGPWLLLLLAAVLGAVLCAVSTLFLHELAILVGIGYLIFVFFAVAARTRRSRGSGAAQALMAVAFLVLVFVTAFNTADWYMAVRGVQAQATVAAPVHSWSHGSLHAYCRVRLPDGSVREVDTDKGACATDVGAAATVVYDPDNRYAPRFGTKADLNVAVSAGVAAAAGAVLVLSPLAVIGAAARRNKDWMTG